MSDGPDRPRLGAHPSATGTQFSLYSTTARACEVRLFDGERRPLATHPLSSQGDGIFAAHLDGVGPGALYLFVLDGNEFPDPFARFLPFGVHGPALVVDPRHDWRHPAVARPLREHIVYELHVGTFTEAGTYDGVRARLPELAALGITAIELMPLGAFPGQYGWGYDGVALLAPFAPYGTPARLKTLIDEAHGLGIAVFLDVVYNHLGPSGNYLRVYSPDYYSDSLKNAWGDSPDFAHAPLRRLVIASALQWLDEYRFDGLRLDAIHAIPDPSDDHLLAELARAVAPLRPAKLLIAEDERNDPTPIDRFGLHALWADDFHHHVQVTLTGERDGYYGGYQPGAAGIADALRGGWSYRGQLYPPHGKPRGKPADHLAAESFVYCIQNHDQIGNRALGERLTELVSVDAYCAASALLLFLPMTPLLFMGQEWAATSPFLYFTDHEPDLGRLVSEGRRAEFCSFRAFSDPEARCQIPDPQDVASFQRSRLRWDERARPPHAEVLEVYRRLLALRREDPVLRTTGRAGLAAEARGDVLSVRRFGQAGERRLLVNLSARPAPDVAAPGAVLFRHGPAAPGGLGPFEVVILDPRG